MPSSTIAKYSQTLLLYVNSKEQLHRLLPNTLYKFKFTSKKVFEESLNTLTKLDRYRLDLQGKYSAHCLHKALSQYNLCGAEYIEDPCPLSEIQYFKTLSNVAVAIDVTPNMDIEALMQSDIDILVIKPSLVRQFETIAQNAARRGKQVVFSSLYETCVGLEAIAKLSEKLKIQLSPGIGTSHLTTFKKWNRSSCSARYQ